MLQKVCGFVSLVKNYTILIILKSSGGMVETCQASL